MWGWSRLRHTNTYKEQDFVVLRLYLDLPLIRSSLRTTSAIMLAAVTIVSLATSVTAFRAGANNAGRISMQIKAGKQDIKDLNLEEMFDVFEKADTKISAAELPETQRKSLFTGNFDYKAQPGASEPFGFFDPLSFCPTNEAEFKKYRESELKHGRVAMLAFLGVFFAEALPFLLGGKITGPAIYQFQQADAFLPAFTANVIGLTAAIEGYNIFNGWQNLSETLKDEIGVAGLKDNYINGDLNFDPLGFKPKSATALKTISTKELNNGRLAMIGVAGIVAQELATGKAIF